MLRGLPLLDQPTTLSCERHYQLFRQWAHCPLSGEGVSSSQTRPPMTPASRHLAASANSIARYCCKITGHRQVLLGGWENLLHKFDRVVATEVTGLSSGECRGHGGQKSAESQLSQYRTLVHHHTSMSHMHILRNFASSSFGAVVRSPPRCVSLLLLVVLLSTPLLWVVLPSSPWGGAAVPVFDLPFVSIHYF